MFFMKIQERKIIIHIFNLKMPKTQVSHKEYSYRMYEKNMRTS